MKNPQGKRLERIRQFESLEEKKARLWLETIAKRKKREQAEIRLREMDEVQASTDCEASGVRYCHE